MENLKSALKTIFNTATTVDKALEDKNITPLEWAQIAIKSISFWKVVKNIHSIKEEFQALTDQSRQELIQWIEEEFNLRNDNLEKQIELLLSALVSFSDFTPAKK